MTPEQLSQLQQMLGQPPQPSNVNGAALIAARHQECDFGTRLLHYLATGDNGGNPAFDQFFASDVGVPGPQARAITDKAIQDCDAAVDKKAADATRAAAATAAAATSAAARSTLVDAENASCGQIGGILKQRVGGDTCASRTPDQIGRDGGSKCYLGNVNFNADGSLSRDGLDFAKRNNPNCFTFN